MVKRALWFVVHFGLIESTDVLVDFFVPVTQILEVWYPGNLPTDIPALDEPLLEFTAGLIRCGWLTNVSHTILPHFGRGFRLEGIFTPTGFVRLEQYKSHEVNFQFRCSFVECSSWNFALVSSTLQQTDFTTLHSKRIAGRAQSRIIWVSPCHSSRWKKTLFCRRVWLDWSVATSY